MFIIWVSQFDLLFVGIDWLFIGKRGLYTSTGGVKIAYLSGVAATANPKSYEFDSEDVKALCDVCIRGNPNYRGVDILLTSQWPEGVDVYDNRKVLVNYFVCVL